MIIKDMWVPYVHNWMLGNSFFFLAPAPCPSDLSIIVSDTAAIKRTGI